MPPRKTPRSLKSAPATESRFANVNGVRLHYLVAGRGDPVVLLHGYAETSHMWRPLVGKLADTRTVIAPDLRGAGQSSTPADGYTKAAMARDIHALTSKLGYQRVQIVGHDIGLMVAYAYAAQYPSEVERIALMDAFLPGIGNWRDVWLMRDLWHFHFYGKTPLALVHGRERIYFEHFWNDFAADATFGARTRPSDLRQSLCPAWRHAQRFRVLSRIRAGREGLRQLCKKVFADANACSHRRKGFRRVPDSAGPAGRKECRRGCSPQIWALADGRSAQSGHPQTCQISHSLSRDTPLHRFMEPGLHKRSA